MSHVAALTRGRDTPSARFRVRQLIPALARYGVKVDEYVPSVPADRLIGRGRSGAMVQAVLRRPRGILASHRHDMTWLQREFVSTYTTLEHLTKAPRVFDIDDAIHLKRDGKAAKPLGRLLSKCAAVTAGNETLAAWAREHCERVEVIPTVVDTQRFLPGPEGDFLFGWIGTRANLPNLQSIGHAIRRVLDDHPGQRLLVVSNARPELPLRNEQWEYRMWSEATEVRDMRAFRVGLMPLDDSPWNRGKCAFKMLQYMAVGVPVVASPVGMNAEVLAMADVGLPASSVEEWRDALASLAADNASARGEAGRRIVVEHFSPGAVAPKLARLFEDVVG